MSALLSPAKPVRTRFKVPGEGSYELFAEYSPPTPTRPYPPSNTSPSSNSPSSSSNSSKPTTPTPTQFSAGPLGLSKVTKLSFIQDATLHPRPPPDDPSPQSIAPTPPSPPYLFSLRKLSQLTSLTAKLSVQDDPPSPAITSSTVHPSDSIRQPPRIVARRQGVLAYTTIESVILLDLATRNQNSLPSRSQPSALALSGPPLNLLIGCVNGEIIFHPELTSVRTPSVYNPHGSTNSSRVVAVAWAPAPPRFLSAHADGGVILHDVRLRPGNALRSDDADNSTERERERENRENRDTRDRPSDRRPGPHEITVIRPGRTRRANPAAVWHIGRASLTACAFSPITSSTISSTTSSNNVNMNNISNDSPLLLALTARDGFLRIVDFSRESPRVAFRSYFGALLCVAWSPDGRYIATGGEDDLVSIWSPAEERLIARLEGHTSWVSAVAWDSSLSQAGRYRLGSAGQDAKLLLWDFALDVLHHRSPPSRTGDMVRVRSYRRDSSASGSAGSSGIIGNGERRGKLSRLRGHSQTSNGSPSSHAEEVVSVIAAKGRAEVPIVEPVVAHVAHGEPLTDVWFQESGVFTADTLGVVKMWSRPPQHSVPELRLDGTTTDLD